MYDTEALLNKINTARSGSDGTTTPLSGSVSPVSLSTLMPYSFAELWPLYQDVLSWGEMNFLSSEAQQARKKNKEVEARIFSRANPQLTEAVQLSISQSANQRGYTDQFGSRAQKYARSGSVASMFSPAGYLTELYREARDLHPTDNDRRLDNRRPDLARISLSQLNMDTELSTLEIANEIIRNNIATREGLDIEAVAEELSTWRLSGATPYHAAYESARLAVLLQDPMLNALSDNPDIARQIDLPSLLALFADISPELYAILTEEVTEDNAKALYEKNFGSQLTNLFLNASQLANWYDVPAEEIFNLTSLLRQQDFSSPVQYYHNGVLTIPVASEENTVGEITQITRTYMRTSQLNYMELLPQGGDSYLLNFSFNYYHHADHLLIGTYGGESSDLYNGTDDPQANQHMSIPITLSADRLKNGVSIGISRLTGGYHFADASFIQTTLSPEFYLLQLNKIIRLYKACNFTPQEMTLLIYNTPTDNLFDPQLLTRAVLTLYARKRYALSMEDALIFGGGLISMVSVDGARSYFDTLFNNPPLGNREFNADGAAVDWDSQDPDNLFRASVIKQGLHLKKSNLRLVWQLAAGEGVTFTATPQNLALLTRVTMLARVHDLSATEIYMLLDVSPWSQVPLSTLDPVTQVQLVTYVRSTTDWLRSMDWSVSEFYLILTTRYSTLMTPDIQNLVNSLRSAINPDDTGTVSLPVLLAPYIAAAGQIDTTGKANSILVWLSQLQPGGTDLPDFLTLVMQDGLTDEETVRLVTFCQVLGQLTLLVRRTGINENLLAMLVADPTRMKAGATVMPLTAETLRLLTRVDLRIRQTGEYALQLLTALGTGTLTTDLLALALGEESLEVQQALTLTDSSAGQTITTLYTLSITLQWLDFSAELNCSPSTSAALMTLRYIDIASGNGPTYAQWLVVSNLLQAGLSAEQTTALHRQLDELASAALSGYYIQTAGITQAYDRDSLYAWLLIDSQVSSDVITTHIAEATADIQLYVNRCQSGLEPGVDRTVLTRQFFTDWDLYNKRYSSWVAASRLAYYPENYIDPTVRTGQTSMMDEMLQTIGQSALSTDTVGDAFKTYMTRFEQIANLSIVSAYHDNTSQEEGRTWFIGKSTADGEKYYWRSLQQNMLSNGKYPATAWSEWLEVGTAIAAHNQNVRPVIFNDRLYVVWITTQATATQVNGKVTPVTDYFLSFSYIRHDGTWSSPVSSRLSEYMSEVNINGLPDKKMYCTNSGNESIIVLFYYPGETAEQNQTQDVSGITFSTEHVITAVANAEYFRGVAWQQFETQSENRVNFFQTEIAVKKNGMSYGWGYAYLSILASGSYDIEEITEDTENDVVTLKLSARLSYSFNGYNTGGFWNNVRTSVDIMRKYFPIGREMYFFQNYEPMMDVPQPRYVAVVQHPTPEQLNLITWHVQSDTPQSVRWLWVVVDWDYREGAKSVFPVDPIDPPVNPNYPYSPSYNFSTLSSTEDPANGDYEIRIGPGKDGFDIHTTLATKLLRFSTTVPPENVFVSFSCASASKTFNGKDDIAEANRPTPNFDTTYVFRELLFNIPMKDFHNGKAEVSVSYWANSSFNNGIGNQHSTFSVYRVQNTQVMSIWHTDSGAQYLQRGVYRTRINTLFGRQLVARANLGLDAVLSMETQQLPEPMLGSGLYVDFGIPAYDASVHGDSREYSLYLMYVIDITDKYLFYSGSFADDATVVRLFVPISDPPIRDNILAQVFMVNAMRDLETGNQGFRGPHFIYTNDSHTTVGFHGQSDLSMFDSVTVLYDKTEPMDFAGANALYFWEMFYYVPAMACQRLLDEEKFDEATSWMKYIWDPVGYYSDTGEPAPFTWNVRPLEEDTSWNPNPLDSVDPDAVAQSDPMHYKVATFMRMLDLLIARGDAAYRLLERDTLNEAKMWYMQALGLLGEEPYDDFLEGGWPNPVLADAASRTLEESYQLQLVAVRTQVVSGIETYTANTLVGLFYPEVNEILTGYWQTLRQRLYNLRHNLSIDGQPLLLQVYASPARPDALLSAAATATAGTTTSILPGVPLPLLRFPLVLDGARALVSQLTQFGSQMLSFAESQDSLGLSELLQRQGMALLSQNIQIQDSTIAGFDADKDSLIAARKAAEERRDSYRKLYDENITAGEVQAMDLYMGASVAAEVGNALFMGGAALDMVPNIYGLAVGGSRYGALLYAFGYGTQIVAGGMRTAADKISQSEAYRRRRQDWEIQRNDAESEIKQFDAQLASLKVRREAAVLQKDLVQLQLAQTTAQLEYLQSKYSNQALYSWLRGMLSSIYYQYYDVALSRCMQAERAWQWHFNDESTTFIRPGAWQGSWSGFMSGETLMLSLAKMEQAWLQKDSRNLEVTRTVSLAEVYSSLSSGAFSMADKVTELVNNGSGSAGSGGNTLAVDNGQLQAGIKLSDLNIMGDYPTSLGGARLIKQISVTLPLLAGPYQDIHALLSYGGSALLPVGCNIQAVSHGMNDSGQFQLDFNDPRSLPFEGVPVSDTGSLTLSFSSLAGEQKELLLSLTDIIFHIRYTISN